VSEPVAAQPAVAQAVDEPRRRLHPLSPLLRGAKALVLVIIALSWNTLRSIGFEWFAVLTGAVTVLAVAVFAVSWLTTGYHVVGRELRIQEGLVWRRNRAIPLERLQSVEVVRPFLAQLTGLAELRLEVVGGGKTEAPLAYLRVADAEELRERLLALAHRRAPAADTPVEPAMYPLHDVDNGDLMLSQLLTPQAFFVPVGVVFVVLQIVFEATWTFIGIASAVTATAGVLLQPARRILHDWDFRISRDTAGRLRMSYGLLETRQQAVPLNRVQTVAVTWPLLWRPKRWLRMRLDIAGAAGPQTGEHDHADRLLPVGADPAARQLLAQVLPGVDLYALPTVRTPQRVRWLHPLAWKWLGAGLTDRVFVTRSGALTREVTLVPYARVQSVRVVQGPIQRRLGIATVYADTAGGRSGVAVDRDLAEAWAMASELAARARQARLSR
jgi:putative membrane protein